ncbi:phosphatase 2C-like domain-containing protein [Mycena rosella]|uniref:Protein phosphatase n=1 Tax=Mycena rosella TaxID=1033263 RepID=A0AAD7MCC1_MYCRO|nr:phosphatase 2C-like domain-containing protein [Mycena rosella]
MLCLRQRPIPSVVGHMSRSYSLQRPYKFHVAAEWTGKPPHPENIPKPKVSFSANSPIVSWRDSSLSRLSSLHPPLSAGEDFFLCTNMLHNSGVSLGIADGVGGWIDQGIDSSMFSQALMYYAHGHFENGWAGEPEIDPTLEAPVEASPEGVEMTPSECLDLAYHDVLGDESIEAGSSTACLLTLNSATGVLRSVNLGDSGFCVIRSSSMFYNARPQTHGFNTPKQLAKLQSARGRNFGSRGSLRDMPRVAETWDTRVRDGDIVILYTDGLSDNVFPAEMLKICSLTMSGPGSEMEQVQAIAGHLVQYARRCMFSSKLSPFELDARRYKQRYQGGKVDDVTVVVALVRETQ